MTDFFGSVQQIKFYLNHYNSIDRRLYSLIKRNCIFLEKSSSIVIGCTELKNLLIKHFSSDIVKIEAIPAESVYKYAHSPYFINRLFQSYYNIDLVEIQYIKDKTYSRLKVDKINFDFKIDKIHLDVSDFSYSLIDYFKNELYFEDSLNIKNFIVKAEELAYKIDAYSASDNYDESLEPLLQYIESFLDEKIILDNSLVVFELNKYKKHI